MRRVGIKLLILFVLIYAGVFLGYRQLEKMLAAPVAGDGVPLAATAVQVEKSETDAPKSGNYQVIITRNIFEAVPVKPKEPPKKEVKPPPAKVVEKKPQKTTLKLILHGTVTGNEQDARAIIVDQKENRQDLYQIGDAVQGALIVAIERGKVTLEVNGQKQVLTIKERQGGGPGGASSATARPSSKVNIAPFVMKSSRTAFSRTPRKKTAKPAKVVPHRRISFRQDNEDPDVEDVESIEEPEQPLDENELEEGEGEDVEE